MFLHSNCSHFLPENVQVPYGSFALPCSRILSNVQSWSQPWRAVLVYSIHCFLWAFLLSLGSSRLVLSMAPFLIFVFPWTGRAVYVFGFTAVKILGDGILLSYLSTVTHIIWIEFNLQQFPNMLFFKLATRGCLHLFICLLIYCIYLFCKI